MSVPIHRLWVVLSILLSAQLAGQHAKLFPDSSSLLFRPLQAAVFEPRIGFQSMSIGRVRLDIGHSADVFSGVLGGDTLVPYRFRWTAGVDAFTYTRLRSESNLKFPVETVDYMFGVNAAFYGAMTDNRAIAGRLRLSHISAHFADGLADTAGVLAESPFVYSREFLDVTIAYQWNVPRIRIYGGGTILFSVKTLPKSVGKVIPQIGAEWYTRVGLPVVIAYNLQVSQIENTTVPNHAGQLIVYPLETIAPALVVCGYFYSGYSIHGMFFDRRERYWALGMQVLL